MNQETLNSIDVNLDGHTADDIIENRMAQRERVETLRTSKCKEDRIIFHNLRELELMAGSLGVDINYDEFLSEDDDDLGY